MPTIVRESGEQQTNNVAEHQPNMNIGGNGSSERSKAWLGGWEERYREYISPNCEVAIASWYKAVLSSTTALTDDSAGIDQ